MSEGRPDVIGVVGGMGPRASAAFVSHLYARGLAGPEQELPRVLLDSDPAFPDRSEAIARGDDSRILALLEKRMAGLVACGATRLVIACVTAHHFLPAVAPELRARVTSLVSEALAAVSRQPGQFLLLSTRGTRQARIFELDSHWPKVAARVTSLNDSDADRIHSLIYGLKRHGRVSGAGKVLDELRRRYRCDGLVLGCTELHLISDETSAACQGRVVDPLASAAESLVRPPDTRARVLARLDAVAAGHRLVPHVGEGRTREASRLRGHDDALAAKCIVVQVRVDRTTSRYAVAVVPGNRRVRLSSVADALGGRSAFMAPRETAEMLTGCVSGSIVPFSFSPELTLIVDHELTSNPEIYFNVARLDESVRVSTERYLAAAQPRLGNIAE